MKPLLLIFSIAILYTLSYGKTSENIEIIVCKDKEKRLFFAGERRHFKRFESVFSLDNCRLKVLTEDKWLRILFSHQKRFVKKP